MKKYALLCFPNKGDDESLVLLEYKKIKEETYIFDDSPFSDYYLYGTRVVKIFNNSTYYDFYNEYFTSKNNMVDKNHYFITLYKKDKKPFYDNELLFEAEDDKSAELFVISQLIL